MVASQTYELTNVLWARVADGGLNRLCTGGLCPAGGRIMGDDDGDDVFIKIIRQSFKEKTTYNVIYLLVIQQTSASASTTAEVQLTF